MLRQRTAGEAHTTDSGEALGDRPVVDSYRRLAEVFHDVLSERSLDQLLDLVSDALQELVPYDTLTIYRCDEAKRLLVPVVARDRWADQILENPCPFGEGVTGWAVVHRRAALVPELHLDPRASHVPGTPDSESEALVSVPLLARGRVMGALNIYRLGDEATFTEEEFELAQRFGDAAALALDNAETHARLERQARTDALTGLENYRSFHERLRSEVARARREKTPLAVLCLDLDDFKRVNDIHGHAAGDQVLVHVAEILRATVRASDVVCRTGGEEFAVVVPSGDAVGALELASRLQRCLAAVEFEPAGRLGVSIGIAVTPDHARNPRDLAACADTAMLAAKSKGGGEVVVFGESEPATEGLEARFARRGEARSIAHLKLLQSLVGKLNRLNSVGQIGEAIITELRSLLDYHNGRVYLVDRDELRPIAFRGEPEYEGETAEALACRVGEGITGRVAATGKPELVSNALECEYAVQVPGTPEVEESIVAVPLVYASRVIGVVVVSKLGLEQFDGDDVRLLEVLAGHAAVALENARLYEEAQREAQHARESAEDTSALLEVARALATARDAEETIERGASLAARLLGIPRASIWLQNESGGDLVLGSVHGASPALQGQLGGLGFASSLLGPLLEGDEPFVVTADELEGLPGLPPLASPRYGVAPLHFAGGRTGCFSVPLPDAGSGRTTARRLRLLRGIAREFELAAERFV